MTGCEKSRGEKRRGEFETQKTEMVGAQIQTVKNKKTDIAAHISWNRKGRKRASEQKRSVIRAPQPQ